MPRHERHHDEVLMNREREPRDYQDRDRAALFSRERGDRFEREQDRGRGGGWGSLMEDDRGRGLSIRDRSRERERSFGSDDYRSDIPRDETERLIASNTVEGTPVYDRHGERLGSIHNFMVDKFRGRVVYAVLRHSSGFLGLDERYYPLDWDQLTYDTRLGGYHIDLTEDQLKDSGSWDRHERWQDRSSMRERGGFERGRFDRERDFDTRPDYARGSMRERW